MKEIEHLLERANKLLKSAELLLKSGDYESSVSRSYYSMFFCAEALLMTKDLKFSSHKGVISSFGEHFVKTKLFTTEAGKRLHKVFEKRLIGDYSFTFEMEEGETEETLKWAKEFVEEAKSYLVKEKYIKI